MSERTYPKLDVDEMLADSEAAPADSDGTTPARESSAGEENNDDDGHPEEGRKKLPLSSLGIAGVVVVALLAVFGIWEYLPSDKQQLREATSRVERLESRNAALEEQLKTQEALTRLSEREAANQTHDKEVMLKDIRACAEILRPYGGD